MVGEYVGTDVVGSFVGANGASDVDASVGFATRSRMEDSLPT